jgi:DnaB-like helicase N terminal domain
MSSDRGFFTGGGIPLIGQTGSRPIADREPPQNIEAEQSLLGSILIDNAMLAEALEQVDVGDFYRHEHQLIFQAIRDLADEGIPIDVVTLADILHRQGNWEKIGGDETFIEIVEAVPHAANAKFYAGVIRERAIARRTMDAATQILRDGYSNEHTAQELLDRASRHLSGVTLTPDEDDDIQLPGEWPEAMAEEAFHGIAGQIVQRILPHTEADPAALLMQFLVAFGNCVGHGPHWRTGATRHGVNLFSCIVGRSSRARKGSSWDFIRLIMTQADEDWAKKRITGGMSTAEGMIEFVRDARYAREKVEGVKAMGGGGYQDVEIDPGEPDKRALWVESEFGSTLSAKGREGNLLDGCVKKFWESGTVASQTKAKPSRCTDAHVSIIGHVTIRELLSKLGDIDICGGFANRFLWVCARRSKVLPRGGNFRLPDIIDLIIEVKEVLESIERFDWTAPISLSPEAWEFWEPLYHELGRDRPGVMDDMCARAEPQTLRLAALFAILDKSTRIQLEHIKAGLAVWNYSEASIRCIWGDKAHDDPDEEKLLAALAASTEGLTPTQIRRQVFKGHKTSQEIGQILGRLVRSGRLSKTESGENTQKRHPSIRWVLTNKKSENVRPCALANVGGLQVQDSKGLAT